MRKRSLKLVALFLFMAALVSCTHLTPAQQTLWALNVYQAQYDEYLSMVINPALSTDEKAYLKQNPAEITPNKINPDLTDEAKKMLRVKKEILIELKPLVIIAAEYHKSGKLPPDNLQATLTSLINRLLSAEED
jgi:hypothetical protein